MKDDVAVLYTTWPDAESAAAVGRILIEERLCACVNILAPMQSIYTWENAVEEAQETPALFKTTPETAGALRDRLSGLHPYETPCILMLPTRPEGSTADYAAWVRANTK